jgi:hypothetical protein
VTSNTFLQCVCVEEVFSIAITFGEKVSIITPIYETIRESLKQILQKHNFLAKKSISNIIYDSYTATGSSLAMRRPNGAWRDVRIQKFRQLFRKQFEN